MTLDKSRLETLYVVNSGDEYSPTKKAEILFSSECLS